MLPMASVPKSKPQPRRLLFVTDLHGSTSAFRKLLDAPERHGVEALVCAGDIAGTRLYPIVRGRNGRHVLYQGGTPEGLDGHAALAEARAELEARGGYPVTLSDEEYPAIARDSAARRRILTRAISARLEEWIALAEDRLYGTGVKCYLAGGDNDDEATLAALGGTDGDTVIPCEGRVVDVLGLPMVSLGWSPSTAGRPPREASEARLRTMLADAIAPLDDPRQAIFNLHAPPRNPRLTTGSRAVAAAIRAHQPLLGLHGHIHESPGVKKIGRTVCINPGSESQAGALLGAVVAVAPGKVASYQLTRD
jgi:Icc-related predicted phosphoesterase